MKVHEVYEYMPDMCQKCISTRWVIMKKFKKNKIMKACLVICGYEEESHNLKTDSPTYSHEVMYLVMLTASIMKWQVEIHDFTSAFLQGGMLEREVFLRLPPAVCPESEVWRLKICIYWLNEASCSWYMRFNYELTNLKGIVSAYDNALFLWDDATGYLMGILTMHVDDFRMSPICWSSKNLTG